MSAARMDDEFDYKTLDNRKKMRKSGLFETVLHTRDLNHSIGPYLGATDSLDILMRGISRGLKTTSDERRVSITFNFVNDNGGSYYNIESPLPSQVFEFPSFRKMSRLQSLTVRNILRRFAANNRQGAIGSNPGEENTVGICNVTKMLEDMRLMYEHEVDPPKHSTFVENYETFENPLIYGFTDEIRKGHLSGIKHLVLENISVKSPDVMADFLNAIASGMNKLEHVTFSRLIYTNSQSIVDAFTNIVRSNPHLHTMDISHTNLCTAVDMTPFANALGSSPKLKSLNLKTVGMTPVNFRQLGNGLATEGRANTVLEKLDLSCNAAMKTSVTTMDEDDMRAFYTSLQYLRNLRELNLERASTSYKNANNQLFDVLATNTKVTSLNFAGNTVFGERSIENFLRSNRTLHSLDLSMIEDLEHLETAFSRIFNGLQGNTTLKTLKLREGLIIITHDELGHFFRTVLPSTHIENLTLQGLDIMNVNINILEDKLPTTKLKVLELIDCTWFRQNLRPFLNIAKSQLTSLNLSRNVIDNFAEEETDTIFESLMSMIESNETGTLESISIDDVEINESSIPRLVSALTANTTLLSFSMKRIRLDTSADSRIDKTSPYLTDVFVNQVPAANAEVRRRLGENLPPLEIKFRDF